ncbi:MAG: helix-turn-helix domain-containing protein [bacterium]|nr:helix-turn-helix domain-containing protein [bacterium]
MLKELQDLGLSEKEARVYLASLELGATTADKLAKHSKIKRPTTYVQLESLMQMGLMSTYEEGKKTMFAPESPELLKRLLSNQQEHLRTKESELSTILPGLMQQFASAGERPVVRFFSGKEGIASVREEVLTAKDKKNLVVYSPEKLSQVFSQEYLDEYSSRRRALGIHSRSIYTYKDYFKHAGLDELTERRYLAPTVLPLQIDIYLFDHKTAILSLNESKFAFVIESSQVTSGMRLIFEFLWSHSEMPKEN